VDPPSEPPDPFVVECEFTAPAAGATLTGPWNGVTVVVTGTVGIASGAGAIERVEVRFGAGGFEAATSSAPGWARWSFAKLVPGSGSIPIVARVIGVGGAVLTERAITITAVLEPKPADPGPPPQDTTPPTVAITRPRPGEPFELDASGQAQVVVEGVAVDQGGGIDRVEIVVDGMPPQPATLGVVTHSTDGHRAEWTGTVPLVGADPHTITARAVDTANLKMTASVEVTAASEPAAPVVIERLLLVEKCRLSTYLGAYGAGRTVKTLSLAPGEKTKIMVKSYRRSSDTATEASSILDNHTEESQREFENALTREQSNKRAAEEASSWNVSGEAGGTWGLVSASVKAGATASTNASREELAKNVVNAVQKHAAKASSKRDIEIKTSRETKREEGEEFASESEIQNINMSRTLNLVFRQANQEFITLLHLVDIRVAYVRGEQITENGATRIRYRYTEVTLSQLDGLLRQVIVPGRREDVRREIMAVLSNVFDHQDEPHTMVEERVLQDLEGHPLPNASYLRVPRKTSIYKDPATGTEIAVPGVILAATKTVMRTDGILCDAVLGRGDALDAYSQGLQTATVEARRLENHRQEAALEKERQALRLVEQGDAEKARIYRDVYPAPEAESLALVTTSAAAADGAKG
jgi:hypothetical protein